MPARLSQTQLLEHFKKVGDTFGFARIEQTPEGLVFWVHPNKTMKEIYQYYRELEHRFQQLEQCFTGFKHRFALGVEDRRLLFQALDKDTQLHRIVALEHKMKELKDTIDAMPTIDTSNIIDLPSYVSNKRKGTDNTSNGKTNWLLDLKEGTIFLTLSKPDPRYQPSPNLPAFEVVSKLNRCVKLFSDLNKPEIYLWVQSDIFCEQNDLAEIIYDPNVTGEQTD